MQYILAEALSSHCDNCPPCLSVRPPPPSGPAAPFVTPRPRAPDSASAQRLPAPLREGEDLPPAGKGVCLWVWGFYRGWGFVLGWFLLMKPRFCAGEGPASKPTPESKQGSQKPARPLPTPQPRRAHSQQQRGSAVF